MKKLIYMSTFVLAALTINSCSSDDNSSTKDNVLVGKWEATTLSYTYEEGKTNSHPFSLIKAGCAVDVIELTKENVGTVTVEEKVEQNCAASSTKATWDDKVIKVTGEEKERTIISVNDKELVLKYLMTYPKFGTIDVIVNYTRK